ncbi:MAG: hypothetical protein Q9187_002769, partial [Circinaria calcarea]
MLAIFFVCLITRAVAYGSLLAKYAQVIGRDTELRSSYEFIVVGGGTSGLTVANRLTENPNGTSVFPSLLSWGEKERELISNCTKASVLVIEYGYLDQQEANILVPGLRNNTQYLFNLTSTPQRGLENSTFAVLAAAVVGGGTVVNGMFFDRGSAPDYDAWVELGNPGWGWKDLLPAWYSLGLQTPKDPGSGVKTGIFWGPSSLDPRFETRSDARRAHYDPAAGRRPSYHLLTGHAVSKITFEGRTATGVESIDRETLRRGIVIAKREVILAAGAAHSPQILKLSGLGSKGLLDSLQISTVVDLPGVGQNFQDHPTLYTSYNSRPLLLGKKGSFHHLREQREHRRFPPLPNVTQNYESIIALARAQAPRAVYPQQTDPSIIKGYELQRNLILGIYASTETSVQETGFNSLSGMPLTLLKPLSRGTVLINSTDPLSSPRIDWGALTNPADLEIMLAAVRRQRQLMATDAMMELGPVELAPGAELTSDEQIRAAIRRQLQPTYWHLSSTCSMMKREYGGVVGPDLEVYGVRGVRVVDASVMPLIPATHTSATVYAVAEK